MKLIYSLYGKINLPLEVVLANDYFKAENQWRKPALAVVFKSYVYQNRHLRMIRNFQMKGLYFAAEGKGIF